MVSATSTGGAMDIQDSGILSQNPKNVEEGLMIKTILLINRGIDTNQPRLIQRAIRQSVAIRKYIKANQVSNILLYG